VVWRLRRRVDGLSHLLPGGAGTRLRLRPSVDARSAGFAPVPRTRRAALSQLPRTAGDSGRVLEERPRRTTRRADPWTPGRDRRSAVLPAGIDRPASSGVADRPLRPERAQPDCLSALRLVEPGLTGGFIVLPVRNRAALASARPGVGLEQRLRGLRGERGKLRLGPPPPGRRLRGRTPSRPRRCAAAALTRSGSDAPRSAPSCCSRAPTR